MQPSRILPDLQCSLLCEDVRQEATGNFILIGVLNLIRIPQVPLSARLCIFNRWTAGLGQFRQNVRVLAPDQTTVLVKGEVAFAMKEPSLPATNLNVFGVKFETAGTYYVEVMVDDVLKLRFPFLVAVVPPAEQAAGRAPSNPE